LRAVAFAYHNMGVIGLEALLRHGYELLGVFSHEDDPGEELWFNSVVNWCNDEGIDVYCPKDVNRAEEVDRIRELSPRIIFSFYYRKMLSPAILNIPPEGCLNLHGSLLPNYRGRAPVNWALIHGEVKTGVTLHYMIEKPDAGDIVGQRAVGIDFEDTALTLYRKLEQAARELLDDLLPRIKSNTHPRIPNRVEEGNYFSSRGPEDGRIDWRQSALSIYNLIRAVTRPYPGAFGNLAGERFLIWWAKPVSEPDELKPGQIVRRGDEFYVGCMSGSLLLLEIEYHGRILKGDEIQRGISGYEGEILL
jgi:methionyl-tRNA formyltransferase